MKDKQNLVVWKGKRKILGDTPVEEFVCQPKRMGVLVFMIFVSDIFLKIILFSGILFTCLVNIVTFLHFNLFFNKIFTLTKKYLKP